MKRERFFKPSLSLLPACGQNCLHLLWLLIDGLIPGEAGLCGETRHCLDQLIDLRAQQRLTVARLDDLRSIDRTDIPVLHRDPIRRAVNRQPQVVCLPADNQVKRNDAGIVEKLVRCPNVVLYQILPVATAKQEGVVAAAAIHRIVPHPTTEGIVPVDPGQHVGGTVTQ
jgi:hypothetical protein